MSDASPWSPQQRRWLQALGHVAWRQGGGDASAGFPDDTAPAGELSVREAPAARVPVARAIDDAPRRAPPRPSAEPGPAAATTPAGAMRRPARLPDRLQLAMLRASGLDPSAPEAQALMTQWPVDRLRGDGAAKRAFWPQLRALRRRP